MRNSAMRMNALVANLLDMARLESGAVQLNRQWQPLEEGRRRCARRLLAWRYRPTQGSPTGLSALHLDAGP